MLVGINDSGEIGGDYVDKHGARRSFLVRKGKVRRLPEPRASHKRGTGFGISEIANDGSFATTEGLKNSVVSYIHRGGVYSRITVPSTYGSDTAAVASTAQVRSWATTGSEMVTSEVSWQRVSSVGGGWANSQAYAARAARHGPSMVPQASPVMSACRPVVEHRQHAEHGLRYLGRGPGDAPRETPIEARPPYGRTSRRQRPTPPGSIWRSRHGLASGQDVGPHEPARTIET